MVSNTAKKEVLYKQPARALTGQDIMRFVGRHGLRKDDVMYYLGITNYTKKCSEPILPYALDLLMRLYDENPCPPPWPMDRIDMPELFEVMYGEKLAAFRGTEFEVQARVNLQNRFSKLLGRSKGRAYKWLLSEEAMTGQTVKTLSDVFGVLGKLTQCEDPGATLERLGKLVWSYRGVDIDQLFPIPTLESPPRREKRGRRPKPKTEAPQKAAGKTSRKKAIDTKKISAGNGGRVRVSSTPVKRRGKKAAKA